MITVGLELGSAYEPVTVDETGSLCWVAPGPLDRLLQSRLQELFQQPFWKPDPEHDGQTAYFIGTLLMLEAAGLAAFDDLPGPSPCRGQPAWLSPMQQEAVASVASWPLGRGIIRAATGAGKTRMALGVALQYGASESSPWVYVVTSRQLAAQSAREMAELEPGLAPSIRCLSYRGLRTLVEAEPEQVWGGLIVDECFVAGTHVGNTRIEDISVGDHVPAWNEATRCLESRRVTAVMRRKPRRLISIILQDGRRLTLTPDHPVMTEIGWCRAGSLHSGSSVLCYEHAQGKLSPNAVPPVWKDGGDHYKASEGSTEESRACLLQQGVHSRLSAGLRERDRTHDHLRLGGEREAAPADALLQSDEGPRSASSAEDCAQSNWVEATAAGRKWPSPPAAAALSGCCPRMGDRALRRDGGATRGRLSDLLQNRRCLTGAQDWNRGRRVLPSIAGEAGARSEEGRTAHWVGVDHVEVHEPTSDGTFGRVCPTGLVYNLEVEGLHTYLAEGAVVHNCHRAAAMLTRGQWVAKLRAPWKVGMSATPLDRSDEKNPVVIGLTGPVRCRIRLAEAVGEGRVSRGRVITILI